MRLAGGGAGAASLGLLTACAGDATGGTGGETSAGRQEIGSGAARGRLLASPAPPPSQSAAAGGLRQLGLGFHSYALAYKGMHGAGGNARSDISHFIDLADEFGLVLLAP